MHWEVRSIDQCGPGCIVAEDIFKGATLIIPKNTPMDHDTIARLRVFGVEWIAVYVPTGPQEQSTGSAPGPESHRVFREKYRENMDQIKVVLHGLAAGRQLKLDQVEGVFDSLYTQVVDNYGLIESINEMRKADAYTYTHGLNVSLYGGLIARWMGLPEEEVRTVIQAGVLHDIGKAKVPPDILNKKGPLLPYEMEEIKKHTLLGYSMVRNNRELSEAVKEVILMHHERENGSGYPLGVTGERINLYTKIIMVADVYDALTSERVYKKRVTPFDTFLELEKMGYDHFDPQVMLVFLNNIANYYTGAKVKLNTGEIGEIACILPQNISKPMVLVGDTCIDLSREPNYRIEEMV